MSATEIKIGKYLLRIVTLSAFALGILGLLPHCASIAQPQGGPRDTLPPIVIKMDPEFGKTNFNGKRIYIEFNEYIKIKDQQKEFFTSPFMKKKPSIALRGKGIQIDLKEPLDSNRTYSLNFGKSIVDNNEDIPYTGLRYVFSTGPYIDSLLMSGYTTDALLGDSLGNSYIMFFDAKADSIPQYDSTVFKSKPLSIGKSFPDGIFIAENLKPIDYRIYGFQDLNGNLEYEPGIDRIAFLDSTYNPLHQHPFNIWYDTSRHYMQANPQIMLRLFMETPSKRQTYTGSSRPLGNKLLLTFTAPHPNITELSLNGIDPSKITYEYPTSKRDTMILWLHAKPEELPDTLKGRLIYQKHDSLMRLQPDTQKLRLAWRVPKKKDKDKEEKDKEKEEKGQKEVNPFKVRVAGGNTINPEKKIVFDFDYPLTKVDTAAIQLILLQTDPKNKGINKDKEAAAPKEIPTKFTFVQDTLSIRKWTFSAPWKADEKYRLVIPAGAFVNTNMEQNDTMRSEFTIEPPDKYATLILNIKGKTPESEYIAQILSPKGVLIREVAHLKTGSHTMNYIDVGSVKIRLIENNNKNGRWDTGSLVARRQPERVEYLVYENNSEEIVTKENWELPIDVDMNVIFGPITMESMERKIERDNQARLKAAAKKRQEDEANKKKSPHSSSGVGMNNITGGLRR